MSASKRIPALILAVLATLGAGYAFGAGRNLFAAVSLLDLTDDASYVYGDLSGTLITYSTGLRVGF